jgi:hypothetical protein
MKRLIVAAALALTLGTVHADPRCAVPPYGMTENEFRALVKDFGQFMTPTQLLPWLCERKYGTADRSPLYNIGIMPTQIDSDSMFQLSLDYLDAARNFAKHFVG